MKRSSSSRGAASAPSSPAPTVLPADAAVRQVHPAARLVAQLLELPRQALADLARAALDLAPVARLDLQPFGETALQAAQRGGIGVLDGGAHEFVEQRQRVVETDLGQVEARVGACRR